MTSKKHNPRNEKPISLRPLKLKDALKKAMEAKPPTRQEEDKTEMDKKP